MGHIDSLIEKMALKTTFLRGFDKESVYLFIKTLYSLHQEETDKLNREKEALEEEVAKLRQACFQMEEEAALVNQRLEEEQQFHYEFKERFDTLTKAVELVYNSKNWIIEDTQKTAAIILDRANEQLDSVKEECSLQQKRRDAIVSQITGAAKEFDTSMEKLRTNLSSMLNNAETLKETDAEANSADADAATDLCQTAAVSGLSLEDKTAHDNTAIEDEADTEGKDSTEETEAMVAGGEELR